MYFIDVELINMFFVVFFIFQQYGDVFLDVFIGCSYWMFLLIVFSKKEIFLNQHILFWAKRGSRVYTMKKTNILIVISAVLFFLFIASVILNVVLFKISKNIALQQRAYAKQFQKITSEYNSTITDYQSQMSYMLYRMNDIVGRIEKNKMTMPLIGIKSNSTARKGGYEISIDKIDFKVYNERMAEINKIYFSINNRGDATIQPYIYLFVYNKENIAPYRAFDSLDTKVYLEKNQGYQNYMVVEENITNLDKTKAIRLSITDGPYGNTLVSVEKEMNFLEYLNK